MLCRSITIKEQLHTTNLRKVGGSVVPTIPPALLDALQLQPGAKVNLAIQSGRSRGRDTPWRNFSQNARQKTAAPKKSKIGLMKLGWPRTYLMKRGEIWLVGLDPTQGYEQKGRRPVLSVSPEAFNRATKVPSVLPITSGVNFARTAGFAVPLFNAGTKTTGIVRCDQPRTLDLAARNGQKAGSLSRHNNARSAGKANANFRIIPTGYDDSLNHFKFEASSHIAKSM